MNDDVERRRTGNQKKKGRSMKKDDRKIQSKFEKDSGDVIEAKQQKGKVEKF
jgi:hypothetical protein